MATSYGVRAGVNTYTVKVLDDEWTAVTTDGENAVQVSQMIIVEATGAEILTPERLQTAGRALR